MHEKAFKSSESLNSWGYERGTCIDSPWSYRTLHGYSRNTTTHMQIKWPSPNSLDLLTLNMQRLIMHCFNSFSPSVSFIISYSGVSTAGENYILECSVNGASDFVEIRWLPVPTFTNGGSRTNNVTNSSSSQLIFTPLAQSDNGRYTCNIMIMGRTISKSYLLTVNGMHLKINFIYVTPYYSVIIWVISM